MSARFLALGLVVCLASCRGGSGGSSMIPAASKASGSASFAIAVPAPASTVPTVRMNLTKTTPGCTLATGGALTCTARIAVPAGSDSFSVTTYAQPNQSGAQVSTSQVTTAISAGRSTTCIKKAAAKAE